MSVDDEALLEDYRGLTDVALRRSLEAERGLYMAEGAKVIARAVAAGHVPRSVLCSPRWVDSVSALLPLGTAVLVRSEAELEAITGFAVHRGALAAMHRPVLPSLGSLVTSARLVVVLEGIVDGSLRLSVGAKFGLTEAAEAHRSLQSRRTTGSIVLDPAR